MSILDGLLGVKYAKKLKEEKTKMQMLGPIVHDGLTGGKVAPDVLEHAINGVAGLFGPEDKEKFLSFVSAAKHARELREAEQRTAEAGPFQKGSPAPQADKVPGNFQSAPTMAEREGLGPMPALPPSPEAAAPNPVMADTAPATPAAEPFNPYSPTRRRDPVPLPQPPEVSAPPAPAPVTPAPQQSVQPIVTNSLATPGQPAPIGSGFASALPPPPQQLRYRPPGSTVMPPGPHLQIPWETDRARSAAIGQDKYDSEYTAKMRELTGVSAFNRAQQKQVIEERIAALKQSGVYDRLSDRAKANLQIGATQITPEHAPINVPGMMKGTDIPEGVDAFGNAIDNDSMYRVRIDPSTGMKEFFPQLAMTTSKVLPDPKSPTGFSIVFMDRTGAEVSRTPNATPPAGFSPTVTTNSRSSTQIKDIGGQMTPVVVPSSSTSTRVRVLPGQQPAGGGAGAAVGKGGVSAGQSLGASPAAPVAIPPKPASGGVRTGASLGPSGSEQRRLEEQPLTADAAKSVREITPMLERIKRLKKAMEPYKNSNTPAEMFLPRLAYAAGIDMDNLGGLISEAEMDSLISAARVTKGTSRSANVLQQGQVHTARVWKDSGKLMYGKLGTIERALGEILSANQGPAAQKYPGLNRSGQPAPSGPAAIPNKPPAASAEEYLRSIGR